MVDWSRAADPGGADLDPNPTHEKKKTNPIPIVKNSGSGSDPRKNPDLDLIRPFSKYGPGVRNPLDREGRARVRNPLDREGRARVRTPLDREGNSVQNRGFSEFRARPLFICLPGQHLICVKFWDFSLKPTTTQGWSLRTRSATYEKYKKRSNSLLPSN